MANAMKAGGVRLASLFREVGLIGEAQWNKHFKKRASQEKGLVDILFQDVNWQTFKDLANLEIRLPSRKPRGGAALPVELTQPLHIRPDEILEVLRKHKPHVETLCKQLALAHKAVAESAATVLADLDHHGADPYGVLLERGILTPGVLSQIVERGEHPAARRNRALLALEILCLNGMVGEAARKKVLERLDKSDFQLARELTDPAKLTSAGIAEAAAGEMILPSVDVTGLTLDQACREFCPVAFMRRELLLPVEVDHIIRLAVSDPLNLAFADTLAILTGKKVLPCYAAPADIIAAINRTFPPATAAEAKRPVAEKEPASAPAPPAPAPAPLDAPQKAAAPRPTERITKLVDSMSAVDLVSSAIESAVATRATDVHIEPQAQGLRVRFRIDGQLHNVMSVPADLALPVISRVKVLANMNVTERRRPQDGHFSLEMENRTLDFRVSAMPSHLGEKLVLRILDEATVLKGLTELGLDKKQQEMLERMIKRPIGLLLVTGPTGSGKTTTLYSALGLINQPGVNITTIEDPVEYQLEGITQVQVDYAIDMDFASGLRAALRQDPDVIMVGEIRDRETARIAIRAALTGHLVFSTLHTNTAVGAVATLFHMGIQPYLVASALAGVVAQRLVKKICPECRRAIRPSKGLLRDVGLDEKSKRKLYRGKGCSACLNTGYSGREGVFEILRANEPMRRLIIEQAGDERLEALALEHGFKRLHEQALEKAFAGVTSPDEILRTVFLSE